MALVLANRVQETSTTTGTGTLTLDGAVLGYQTFAAGIGSGNTCYYAITSGTGAWEVGIGTVGTGTLARTTLLSSSTGSLISFTGTLNVYVTYPSEKSVNLDASNVMTGYAISGGTINGTTVGATTVAAGSFTTLNSSGDTRLGGLSGNQSLQVNNVASAVNYAQIVGAVTGGFPSITAQGTDTNIILNIAPKGTGALQLQSGGATVLNVSNSGTGVGNYINIYPTSGFINWSLVGPDTNIGYGLNTKGTGAYYIATGGGTQAVVSNTASAVNYLNLTGAATGAAPTLSAQGSDANIGLVLSSKGTGVVALGGSTVANSGLQVVPTASAVNYAQVTGAVTNFGPLIVAAGTDANIAMTLRSKGGYFVVMQSSAGVNIHDFAPVSSAVNFLRTTNAVTTGAPELSAQGSDTNINLKLTPKGAGNVQITGTAYSPNFNLTDAATIAWDTATAGGQVATFTFVSSNRTMGAPTNLVNGAFYALAVIQNAGSNTLTWNSVFKWAAGTAPTLSTAAGAKDYFTFRSDGTNLYQQGISQAVA